MRVPGATGESRCWLRNSELAEQFLNEERTGPPKAALTGMNMLVETEGDKNYSGTEYVSWLGDAGVVEARVMAFDAPCERRGSDPPALPSQTEPNDLQIAKPGWSFRTDRASRLLNGGGGGI